jgi:hypothetical protein
MFMSNKTRAKRSEIALLCGLDATGTVVARTAVSPPAARA